MRISANIDNQFCITALYTAFRHTYPPGYFYRGEAHNFIEIVIVLDGTIGVLAGNDIYTLTKGQMIIHDAMEFHRLWVENTSPDAEVLFFTFSAKNMPNYSSKLCGIQNLDFATEILDEINTSFEKIDISILKIREGREIFANMAVKKLEMLVLNAVADSIKTVENKIPHRARQFEIIVKFLENNEHRNLTVPEIAEATNMSESNLQKIFMKYTGMGVISYFTYLKMTTALTMIESGKSIKEVSSSLGYINQNYFSTVFKNFWKESPSKFKPK